MAGSRNRQSSRINRLVVVIATTLAVTAACAPPSVLPDGTVSQIPPLGVNGMTSEAGTAGGNVWMADLFGGQLLRFDLASGTIAERYGPSEGLCGTDDLVVLPDGDLVATCPGTDAVIRVERGGTARVLARGGRGVNPIELDPSGASVLVGFESEYHDELLRVPIDGGAVEVVAEDLPSLNGFAFGPDGLLYVPTGGPGGIFGNGGIGRIDPATGSFEQLDLTFDDPSRHGFNFACGVDVAPDGTIIVAQCIDPSVFAVDPTTGAVSRIGRSALQFADNVTILHDGKVLLSGFLGPEVTVFAPQPDGTWRRSVTRIGS